MSEEQHNEETEVEAHTGPKASDVHKFNANSEPGDEAEVEGHIGIGGKTSIPKNS